MAEAVTISHGDTLTKILKNKRGLKDHEVHAWLDKLRPLNPHIGDLNRIFAGERVLIPDSCLETVPDAQVWQNAFRGIPRALEFPHNGHNQIFWTGTGVTIDSIAQGMFEGTRHQNLPLSAKRAVLIHNNPDLTQYLAAGRLPANMLVDITPQRLSRFDIHYWQGERPLYMSYLQNMAPMTREMFQEVGPEDTYIMARLIEALREKGASVGQQDIVRGIGYGVGGVSALAASGEMSVATIDGLLQQMATDAVKKFGPKLAASKKGSHLARMAKFLRSHPNYQQVMRQTRELPRFLLPARAKLLPPPGPNIHAKALARYFRKGYFQRIRRMPSGQHLGPIARQLNGRISMFKALGRHASWYVPTVIGLYNVYEAPAEVKMRTLFKEGFGVVGGWAGTEFGAYLGGAIAICVLGLGPFGLFLTVFICATAGGIVGNEISKGIGGRIYDAGDRFGDRIYHSLDDLIGAY